MDIKDFILFGGGILILLVVAHGFWIAYRARQEPYRLDIVPDLIPDDVDEIERLRGELPNGGARLVNSGERDEWQTSLELEVPETSVATPEETDVVLNPTTGEPLLRQSARHEAPVAQARGTEPLLTTSTPASAPVSTPAPASSPSSAPSPRAVDKHRVQADILTDDLTESEPAEVTPEPRARVRDIQLVSDKRQASSVSTRPQRRAQRPVERTPERTEPPVPAEQNDEPRLQQNVEELVIVNVVAQRHARFSGADLVTALRNQSLRYGEMNIFHRIDTASKIKQFSVANLVEPGTFDLSDLDGLTSPGMSFFMQLPGPEKPMQAFDEMLNAAQKIALELGGELKDEQLSVLTGQTKEHLRQRIAEFARKRLSKRA
ncbi:MAG: cell division protein ZipA [Pseudomonadota bacterium]